VVTAGTGTPPYSFSWNTGQTTASINSLCAGTYTCTITDSASCAFTVTATVTSPPPVVVTIATPADICIGQSSTLTASASGGTPGYTYTWTPAFTGNPYVVSPTTSTPYSVTATDASGCVSSGTPPSVTVNVKPPLSGFGTTTTTDICIGTSTTLSAAGVSGGDGTYTYSWMPGSLTGSPVTVSPTVSTIYILTISDGCTTLSVTSPVPVNVQPKPVPKFSIDPYTTCVPTCVTFTDLTTISSGTYSPTWSIDGTIIGSSPSYCFGTSGLHTVSLLETSTPGGCKDSISKIDSILVYDVPVADFTYGPQPASINYPTITFTDASTNATGWSWNFADSLYNPGTNISNLPSPDHTYSEAGTYCVDLIVTNSPACRDTVENCLVIEPDFTFYIPNSFTPNRNGLNDEFYPKGLNINLDKYEMQIYDRWGNLVFRTTDFNEHWKGNAKGSTEIVEEDVYVYIITVKDKVGERHQYIGHVTIVK
jgi:gliding motility-associated-like protein